MSVPYQRLPYDRKKLVSAPDWRWRRALALVESPHLHHPDYDDSVIMAGVGHIRREQNGCISRSPQAVAIAGALELYRQDTPLRWKLDAHLIARRTSRSIAKRLGLDRNVAKWYRPLFYDIRTFRLGHRNPASLIGRYALEGLPEDDLALLWKYAACKGSLFLDAVLAVTTGEGQEAFCRDDLDTVAGHIELLRIPLSQADHLARIADRQRYENAGYTLATLNRPKRKPSPILLAHSIDRKPSAAGEGLCTSRSPVGEKPERTSGPDGGGVRGGVEVECATTGDHQVVADRASKDYTEGVEGVPERASCTIPPPAEPPERERTAGWRVRGQKAYYYESARIDGRSKKIYRGTGPVGRLHSIRDGQLARWHAPIRAEEARLRHLVGTSDRLWCELWAWLTLLGEAHMLLTGHYRHRGQWRKATHAPRTRGTRPVESSAEPDADLRSRLQAVVRDAHSGSPESRAALENFLTTHRSLLGTSLSDLVCGLVALWATSLPEAARLGEPLPEGVSLVELLEFAVRIAMAIREHSRSLLEPGVHTPWAATTLQARVEKAENRVRNVGRLSDRIRSAGVLHSGNTSETEPVPQSRAG